MYGYIMLAGFFVILCTWLGLFVWYMVEKGISFVNDAGNFCPSDTWEKVNDVVFWKMDSCDRTGDVHPVNLFLPIVGAVVWPIPLVVGIIWGTLLYLRKQKREEKTIEGD